MRVRRGTARVLMRADLGANRFSAQQNLAQNSVENSDDGGS